MMKPKQLSVIMLISIMISFFSSAASAPTTMWPPSGVPPPQTTATATTVTTTTTAASGAMTMSPSGPSGPSSPPPIFTGSSGAVTSGATSGGNTTAENQMSVSATSATYSVDLADRGTLFTIIAPPGVGCSDQQYTYSEYVPLNWTTMMTQVPNNLPGFSAELNVTAFNVMPNETATLGMTASMSSSQSSVLLPNGTSFLLGQEFGSLTVNFTFTSSNWTQRTFPLYQLELNTPVTQDIAAKYDDMFSRPSQEYANKIYKSFFVSRGREWVLEVDAFISQLEPGNATNLLSYPAVNGAPGATSLHIMPHITDFKGTFNGTVTLTTVMTLMTFDYYSTQVKPTYPPSDIINPDSSSVTTGKWFAVYDTGYSSFSFTSGSPATTGTSGNQLGGGAIAGIVIGILVGVVAIIVITGIIVFILTRRHTTQQVTKAQRRAGYDEFNNPDNSDASSASNKKLTA